MFNPGRQYNATGYWPKKLVSMNTTWRDENSVSEERDYPYPEMLVLRTCCSSSRKRLTKQKGALLTPEVYQYIDSVRARKCRSEGCARKLRDSIPTSPASRFV